MHTDSVAFPLSLFGALYRVIDIKLVYADASVARIAASNELYKLKLLTSVLTILGSDLNQETYPFMERENGFSCRSSAEVLSNMEKEAPQSNRNAGVVTA